MAQLLRINEIIDAVREYHREADVGLIMKAYVFSAKVHKDQVRRSGEPYMSHPLAVAALATEMHLDVASLCAALLHDTVEDTTATVEDISQLMGPEVAELVDGLTKISKLSSASNTAHQAESFRKMILAMAKDIRVLLIKLADRLHNMRTLGFLPQEKQKRIARETLDIYAPMAHRLGIRRWQAELEDLSLFYLEPEIYQQIKQGVATRKSDREKFIKEVKEILIKAMNDHGLHCTVDGRPKHFYSIYQKMLRRGVAIDGLYDLIAFRVIVDSLKDCYEALGVVHNLWTPIPGRFRDYVGMPKPNMYQSLHTSVVGPMGQRMEVQIRTRDMHQIAEEGIAAHWQYKEGGKSEGESFSWLRRLLDHQRETDDPSEFLQALRMDLYPDEIFVFTPTGEVRELPRDATPVDFAYSIHTEVGHKCVGAKVNGRMVPLRHKLHNGDQVEIITQANTHPSKDWLKFAVSSRARSKIRAFIRESEHEQSVALGRDLFDRELRKNHLSLTGITKDGRLNNLARELSYTSTEHMLAAVAYGKLSPKLLLHRLLPKPEVGEKTLPERADKTLKTKNRRSGSGIKVKGEDGVLVRFAKCCSPVPGDPIVGYITRGRGVTVHQANCSHLMTMEPERKVEVDWDVSGDQLRPVRIQVRCDSGAGMLADMAGVLKSKSINILEAAVHASANREGLATFVIQVHDADQLQQVFSEMRKLKGVIDVQRVLA